jgi:hypothetical protein
MKFGKWDSSADSGGEQQKRLQRAKTAELTPVSLDRESRSGIFIGNWGEYETTLQGCTCMDFSRRKLPCKHMYRLAIELGLINEEAVSDPSKIILPNSRRLAVPEAIGIIEKLSDAAQRAMKDFLYENLYHTHGNVGMEANDATAELVNSGLLQIVRDKDALLRHYSRNELNALITPLGVNGFKRNMKYEDLIHWCFENISDEINVICAGAVALAPSPIFSKCRQKTYSYLVQKFDHETEG